MTISARSSTSMTDTRKGQRYRPTLFIGSSSAGLDIAQALQENLMSDFDVEIWNQGAFEVGEFNLEALINTGRRTNFAVLVLTPDDLITVANVTRPSPRDNVIFEMGFFLGTLGRRQAFIVHEEGSSLKLPTDIDGVTCATYRKFSNGNLTAALGNASTKIKKVAASNGPDTFNGWLEEMARRKREEDKQRQLNVQHMLKNVCNALSIPNGQDTAKLRAFVFCKEEETLVCTHFWAANQTEEAVGVLKFDINPETENQVAVVKAAVERKVCAAHISALPDDLQGVEGKVDKSLCFVLAAPIIGPNGEVWGTVDFDTSSDIGETILSHDMTRPILFELGKHLYLALTGELPA